MKKMNTTEIEDMDILKFALFCNKFREKMESVQHQEDVSCYHFADDSFIYKRGDLAD